MKNGKVLRKLSLINSLQSSFLKTLIVIIGLVITATIPVGAGSIESGIDDSTALQTSLNYLQSEASQWGIQNANDEFSLNSVFRDQIGQIHVRFDQVYKGVPVFGKQLIVHLKLDGSLLSITGDYQAGITVSTKHKLSGQEAKDKARKKFPGPVTEEPSPELMLFTNEDGKVVLVHKVKIIDDKTPRRIEAFVDADNGEIVFDYDNLQTLLPVEAVKGQNSARPSRPKPTPTPSPTPTPDTGTGNSLYSGLVQIPTSHFDSTKYYLIDPTRGNMQTTNMNHVTSGTGNVFTDADNTWGTFTTSDPATVGVDAHFGAVMTFDYYFNVHGRSGIYNDGKGTLSRVHYGINYSNAYWSDSCKCMTYGDGDGNEAGPVVSLDVAGHEMTHGVTSATAGLVYRGESGGLNEAMSDIFGTAVEFYASAYGTSTPDYWIGEDVWTPKTPGDALRYMDDPTRDGYSIDNYANYYNGLNVHYSSGIANNAFYLLSEGGTHRLGGTVTGIGLEKAERIFYRALTVYMTPREKFSNARAHTVQAAVDLGLNSSEIQSVNDAWSAVGVY